MADIEIQVKRIQEKLQLLLKQQNILQKDNEELKKELAACKKEADLHMSVIDHLKQQVSVLKLNSAEMNNTDKKEFEKRLNFYIREIDRCIEMLSS